MGYELCGFVGMDYWVCGDVEEEMSDRRSGISFDCGVLGVIVLDVKGCVVCEGVWSWCGCF